MKREENVTMATNKTITKVAALLLLTTFGLTACNDSEVKALPSSYDTDKIVEIAGEEDIYNNIASTFYDAIHDGSFASDVLEEVLYEYAQAMLGRYNKVSGKNYKDGEVTLKEIAAYVEAGTNADKVNAFIASHKAYWSVNASKERVDDSNTVVSNPETAPASAREKARVLAKWNSIEERIAEAMYEKISSGSYSYRDVFYESKFVNQLRFDGKEVSLKTGITPYEGMLTTDIEPKDVFTKFLNREFYQSNAALDQDEKDAVNHYVEDELIPTIYRSLLTEQYLLDETYNSLGRAYARKINVITITNNDDYDLAAPLLMNSLVKKINTKTAEADAVNLDTFKTYANVWKGVDAQGNALDGEAKTIADALVTAKAYEVGTVGTENFYKGSKYGDMMEKYAKINKDPLLTDTSIEAEFTGNNAYTAETGKTLKTRSIVLNDYTTTGWFTKSSGVDGLPSSITTRLFNVAVATALDNSATVDRLDDAFDAEAAKKESNYVAKINGKYYLKVADGEQGDSDNDILFYDRDSKTYYIVQIEEAVNSSKFSKTNNEKNYTGIYKDSGEKMEEYVNAVLKIVAKSDSNETLSKKHWLGQMNLEYHDQVVYDYFKANFPELFESD